MLNAYRSQNKQGKLLPETTIRQQLFLIFLNFSAGRQTGENIVKYDIRQVMLIFRSAVQCMKETAYNVHYTGGTMDQKKIQRINALAKKSKTAGGLTPAEKEEQALLRREYIEAIKHNVRTQMNNIDMIEMDGSVVNLGEKYGRKNTH